MSNDPKPRIIGNKHCNGNTVQLYKPDDTILTLNNKNLTTIFISSDGMRMITESISKIDPDRKVYACEIWDGWTWVFSYQGETLSKSLTWLVSGEVIL